ncbi:hypothetical protein [Streptomyces sp. NPDC102283]|uniref:hypothetical protein n=1 Tax=Streptomyces sp. NPDC102283 TaxID=3366155 RepID=UPI00382B3ECE
MRQCARWHRLPLDLAREAGSKAPGGHLDRAVRCHLSTHEGDEHHGFLTELDAYGTALWLRWCGRDKVEVVTLPDCPALSTGRDRDGCRLFADHIQQHTWEGSREVPSRTS